MSDAKEKKEISLPRSVGEPGSPEAGLSSAKAVKSASPAPKLAGDISGAAAAALGGLLGGNIPNPWRMLVLGERFMAATGLRELSQRLLLFSELSKASMRDRR